MSKGNLKPKDEKCIHTNYRYLKYELEPLFINDFLFEKNVITLDEKEKIKNRQCKSERIEILLTALLHSGPGKAFNYFLQSLEESYPHVLDRLEQTGKDIDETKAKDDEMKAKDKDLLQLIMKLIEAPNEIKAKDNKIKDIDDEFTDIGLANDEIPSKENEIKAKEDEILQLKKEQGTLNERLERLQDLLAKTNLKKDNLKQELNLKKEEILKLMEEKASSDNKLAAQDDEINRLKTLEAELKRRLETLNASLAKMKAEKAQKEEERIYEEEKLSIRTEKSQKGEERTYEEKMLSIGTEKGLSSVYIKHQEGGAENVTVEKNEQLIPVTDFSVTDLPPCYRHDEMLQLITSLADITVKVEITGVSEERKQFWTENIDPLIDMIDPLIASDILLGSGKVDDVFFRTDEDGPNPCQCEKCKNAPVNKWGEIRILTTAQLMYDDDDAKHFSATFFFDDDEQSADIRRVQGHEIMARSIKKDLCMFTCFTCDVELVEKLEKILDKFEESWEKAFDKYIRDVKWEWEKLVIIIYHPYGQRKHIALGKKIEETKGNKKIAYDAPTYPGSSGAYVLIPDFDVKVDIFPFHEDD